MQFLFISLDFHSFLWMCLLFSHIHFIQFLLYTRSFSLCCAHITCSILSLDKTELLQYYQNWGGALCLFSSNASIQTKIKNNSFVYSTNSIKRSYERIYMKTAYITNEMTWNCTVKESSREKAFYTDRNKRKRKKSKTKLSPQLVNNDLSICTLNRLEHSTNSNRLSSFWCCWRWRDGGIIFFCASKVNNTK